MNQPESATNNSHHNLQNLRTMNLGMGTTASMEDENHPLIREEEKRRIKLVMLMQQLDFLFYALVVSCYIIDGKNLIFILRTVSEVQFSQPKQIQPDRPLRFFTLASFAICVCALLSHLSLLSASNYNPNGILVDFIGQSTWKHQAIAVIFLVGLDFCSCFVQLLLVLISFTQSHSISISVSASTGSSRNSFIIAVDQDVTEERENQSLPSGEGDSGLSSKSMPTEEPLLDESSELLRKRIHQSRSSIMTENFLFDLTFSEVISCLFSTTSPTNSSHATPITATPAFTPSPSRALESTTVPSAILGTSTHVAEDPTGSNSLTDNPHQDHASRSTEESLSSTNLTSHSVIVPIV